MLGEGGWLQHAVGDRIDTRAICLIRETLGRHNGLADFAGLRVTGTVPIKQEIVNGLIAELLQSGQAAPAASEPSAPSAPEAPPSSDDPFATPAAPSAPPVATPAAPPVDLRRLVLGMVRKAEIKADDGVITLEFEIQR